MESVPAALNQKPLESMDGIWAAGLLPDGNVRQNQTLLLYHVQYTTNDGCSNSIDEYY